MQPETLILFDADITAAFDPQTAFESQLTAFRSLHGAVAENSPKLFLDGDGTVPIVFAYGARSTPRTGVCVRVACAGGRDNHRRGLPELDAVLIATDADTGLVRAVLEGNAFTLIRTAAAAAVAADRLSVPDAQTLAIFGSGPQAEACAAAIARIRPLSEIRIWSPTAEHRSAAAHTIAATVAARTAVADSPADAVRGAEIVVAVTNSRTPVFPAAEVAPGALVISMGSYRPDRFEVDAELLERAAAVVVDDVDVALATAGPVITWAARAPGRSPLSLGAVLAGSQPQPGRDEIIFFNSVGLGVQDAAAADALLAIVEQQGLGLRVGSVRPSER